jgi:hypothetical protein
VFSLPGVRLFTDQVPATHNERRRGQRPGETIKYLRCTTSGAAGIGLGATAKYLRLSTSGAARSGLSTTAKYLRGTAGSGLGTTANYLRCAANCAAGNGLTTAKYLRRTTSGAAGSGLGTAAKHLRHTTRQRLRPGYFNQAPAAHNESTPRAPAWARRSSTCDAQRAAPREKA